MADPLEVVIRAGRPGGAALLALGFALLAYTYWDLTSRGSFFVAMPGLGLLCLAFGGMLVVMGSPHDRALGTAETRLPPAEFLVALTEHERPFWVCTRCRTFGGPGQCLGCGNAVDVYEVADDSDLKMVIASVS